MSTQTPNYLRDGQPTGHLTEMVTRDYATEFDVAADEICNRQEETMTTSDILKQALYAASTATDEIAPGQGQHMRKFADELYPSAETRKTPLGPSEEQRAALYNCDHSMVKDETDSLRFCRSRYVCTKGCGFVQEF